MLDNDKLAYQRNKILEAREFVEKEIRPFASDFEKNEGIPKKLIKKMGKLGYLAATFPSKYNGLELDPVQYGLFSEEFSKGCSSTRGLLTVHTSLVGETLLKWGTEAQKEKYLYDMGTGEKIAAFALSEPDVGTDASHIKTNYTKVKGGYVVTGKKKWISFGDIADIFLVVASNEGKVSAFIAERQFGNIKTKRIRGLLGSRAAYIAEVEFDHVFIPQDNILAKEGLGFSYIANTALDAGRYSIAWAGVGLAQAALEEMVNYARSRKQFGQKIYKFQLIKGMIGDAVSDVAAARALCIRAGEMRSENNDDAIAETLKAKHFSSKVAMSVAKDALQVHGGNGCCSEYPIERLFREAKILEIIEGTTQIQQELLANYGLRKFFRTKKSRQLEKVKNI